MGKKMKKWLCVLLAVVLTASALPLIAGAIVPSAGETIQDVSANGQAPLKVEIKSNKEKYTLLGKMEFTATITNTSNETVENISAQAQLGLSLRPLKKGSQFTATKASLAPNKSFSFTYYADLKSLKGLDNLLLPVFWVSSLFHGGKADIGNAGSADVEVSKTVGLVSLFSKSYDVSTMVGVWYEKTVPYELPALDDRKGVWREVIDPINEMLSSAQSGYTGSHSHDTAIAQEAYEKIISFLEDKKQQGYVKGYAIGQDGISYGLSTGLVAAVGWEEIYPPSFFRKELQAQSAMIKQNPQEKSKASATFAPTSNKLSIAVLQPRYSKDGFLKLQFKTSVFENSANAVVDYNSNYQFLPSLKDEAVTIDIMKNLENNRIIIFDSHGKIFDWANNIFGLQLSIVITEEMANTPQYSGDCYPEDGKMPRIILGGDGIFLTTEFFRHYYKNKTFNNTLFYSGTCHGADNAEFFDTLNARGVVTLLAYKNPVHPSYGNKMFDTILGKSGLLNTVSPTVKTAVSVAKTKHGEKDNSWITEFGDWMNETFGGRTKYEPAELVLFGDGDWSLDKEWTASFGEYTATVKDSTLVGGVNPLLAGVNVKAINAGNTVVAQHTTDSTGKVKFTLPVGEYSIVFSKEGYRTDTFKDTIVYGELVVWDAIIMQKLSEPPLLSSITGKILEQGTNAPLYGVKVEAIKAGTTEVAGSAITDSFGLYAVGVERNATYNLKFTKAGYNEQTRMNVNVVDGTMALPDVVMEKLNTGGEFAGGTGTAIDPYLVSTPAQLDNVRNNLSGYYKLVNDIDLASWGNWEPIGADSNNPFRGVFDGNGYVINKMTININSNHVNAGLFGCLRGGTIKNVGIVDFVINVTSSNYACVGSIAGVINYSTINNCYNTGNVNIMSTAWESRVGGIVGYGDFASTISNCYNTGNLNVTSNSWETNVGGISGKTSCCLLINCYNTGNVNAVNVRSTSGGTHVGGIAGKGNWQYVSSPPVNVRNCYTTGEVNAESNENAYAGGIIGRTSINIVISNSYFMNNAAAAVGMDYDNSVILTNVLSLSEAQMKQQFSFVGFDFTNTWAISPSINNGYPYLRGMQP